ncbi:hypothetical protein F52700_4914 [Fusarium sp. NRRL 52700]|nr:hypothetical protein F52700_4914 [Fusarium sp. NRRL 52700]
MSTEPQAHYQSLQAEDAETSSTGESPGEQATLYRPSRQGSICAWLNRFKWFIDTVLLLLILVILIVAIWSRQETPSFQSTGDLTGFVPNFPNRITTFTPDPEFFPDDPKKFFTNATRNKWLGLVPGKSLATLCIASLAKIYKMD